ncbi:MAG: ATP-binding cassette domain-containing protein [Oceanivirga sp.]|nr:ATP-binding cassette domain-containing protein [Oceanivirga sp.]
MKNAINIKNLKFTYRSQEKKSPAIDIDKLEIKKGEFVVIMGPSGAGKTTLANCLNRLIPRFIPGEYEGKIEINDQDISDYDVSKISKEIGLVFQDFESQLFSTNVRLELGFGPENFSVPREEIIKRIDETIDLVDLKGLEERSPATLSGGQKQRLAIGSVLTTKPNILCMDEPTTDLDPLGKIGIFTIAKKLRENTDFTLVIIEHETEEAVFADRIILLEDGKISKIGTPKEILTVQNKGIKTLQIPKFFGQYMETKDLPLLVDEGLSMFEKLNLEIDEEEYKNLLKEDEQKHNYGDVIIDVKDLKHTYSNGKEALKGISTTIRQGEFVAVLGANGGGKTTFVKHLNRLLEPTSGEVIVYGKDTKKSNVFEIGKDVAYAFQNPDHQIFKDNVYDEVAFSPTIRGLSEEEIKERVAESLKAVDLINYEEKDPFLLSKGERQRVAVASILSSRPKVIILDEPTTGLDYREQKRMMALIKKLNELGHTIIMVTHTMWAVSEYAHRVIGIKDGRIEIDDYVRNVFKNEEKLKQVNLKAPHIVRFSNKLGHTVLSVDEMTRISKKGGE